MNKREEERKIKEKDSQVEGEKRHGRNTGANRFIINTSVFSSGALSSNQ